MADKNTPTRVYLAPTGEEPCVVYNLVDEFYVNEANENDILDEIALDMLLETCVNNQRNFVLVFQGAEHRVLH